MRPYLPTRRTFQLGLVTVALTALSPLAALAQTPAFPNKPVKFIVTYPAGGSSDLMARIMAQKLGDLWAQPIIVESKPGAAGSIGMEYAARQPADGYTLVIGNLGPASVNPIISKVPYRMEKDFIPVALTATGSNILVVPAASPYKTLEDLLTAARARPGSLSFGTSGKRSQLSPDIPTFAEAGLAGLVAENWWGIYLPAGTPKAVVDSYQAALVKIMADPDLREKFNGLGVEAQASTQADFRSFMAAEHAKYSKLVADNGIKAE